MSEVPRVLPEGREQWLLEQAGRKKPEGVREGVERAQRILRGPPLLPSKDRMLKLVLAEHGDNGPPTKASRGFFINFPSWQPASPRKPTFDEWPYDGSSTNWPYQRELKTLAGRKAYSRAKWFQEYSWSEERGLYLCRGYWAVKGYMHPMTECLTTAAGLEMWQACEWPKRPQWRCCFRELPDFPPEVGIQPLDRQCRLVWVQCHYFERDGTPAVYAHWTLRWATEISRAWIELAPGDGFLVAESLSEAGPAMGAEGGRGARPCDEAGPGVATEEASGGNDKLSRQELEELLGDLAVSSENEEVTGERERE